MKGDFTRTTFDRTKHYSSVRWQQGRVHVDADWNEAMDILAHQSRTTRRDVIGLCGGPMGTDADGNPLAGFLVYVKNGDLFISRGRYYVDGMLVENEAEVGILKQPDLPPLPGGNSFADVLAPPGTELSKGTYLAFLDVWERHLTALEDPAIREVALGGPDTASRTKVVWQMKLMPAMEAAAGALTCDSELGPWQTVTQPSTGRLTAQAEAQESAAGPCIVPARAGYRGLENQLYRVEVHRVISSDEITIKWSRENGSVVSDWLSQDSANPHRITVRRIGRDQVLGFAADDWVELTDDSRELQGRPGTLVQIKTIEGNVLVLDPGGPMVGFDHFPIKPKVRRWDMPGETGEIRVDLTEADRWIELEHGIQVQFDAGIFRPGDYWQIPARAATRDIEWPRDAAENALAIPPHGIQHHYCRMGLVEFDGERWQQLHDCRRLFPPLTELIRFFHVGGDGQEALPGQPVRMPLQVGVANGSWPVAGAKVQFEVVVGKGRLAAQGQDGCPEFTTGGAARVVAWTGPDGVAACCWRLDAVTLSQQVKATLLEIDGKLLLDDAGELLLTPITFSANQSVASQVAYDPRQCSDLSRARTVQQAIDLLCRRPQSGGCCVSVGETGEYQRLDEAVKSLLEKGIRDICLCLLTGDHELDGLDVSVPAEKAEGHIRIVGCGPGSRVHLNRPMRFSGLQSVSLEHAEFEPRFVAEGEGGAVALERCFQVRISACRFAGFTAGDRNRQEGALLSIVDARHIQLGENRVQAALVKSFEQIAKIFGTTEVDFLVKLWSLPEQGTFEFEKFRQAVLEAARNLAAMDTEQRKRIYAALQPVWTGDHPAGRLSPGEERGILNFANALIVKTPLVDALQDGLSDIHRAAVRSRPGVGVIVGRASKVAGLPAPQLHAALVNNEFDGVLSIGGLPAPAELIDKIFTEEFLKQLESRLRSPEQRVTLRGLLGDLQVRGNQLVQLAVASQVVEPFRKLGEGPQELFNLFGCCLCSDNVIHGADSFVVFQHLAMTANDLTLSAFRQSGDVPNSGSAVRAALVIADSSIYTGNHGREGNVVVLRDASRLSSQAANLEITIG